MNQYEQTVLYTYNGFELEMEQKQKKLHTLFQTEFFQFSAIISCGIE